MKEEDKMRVIMIDIDTLRADHMGCYGYSRNTTPVIDSIAREGVRFDDYYCPNAPCLPSRASMISGQYGIHNGIVGHGGTAADMRLQGRSRMMHVHYWDPHTPYRTPLDYENSFEGTPMPDDWITEEIFQEHLLHIGPHGANEINMWNDHSFAHLPKHPGSLKTLEEPRRFLNSYDDGIRYTDDNIGKIMDWMKENGLYDDDLAIIITADHGEDLGEFGVYAEHGMADDPVCRIPLIVRWPGMRRGAVVKGFHDNTDLAPTVQELLGTSMATWDGVRYDGVSFAKALNDGTDCSRPYAVLTQCAHVCQRSVRFDD